MWNMLIPAVAGILDKVLPDPKMASEAKFKVMELAQKGELDLVQAQLSAIIAEAQSPDPWTSRARPSFLYVMYILILMSIPMGVLSAFNVGIAQAITNGMTGYLSAIPDSLYALFGTGYLGYTAARQWGKTKGTDK